MAQSKMPPKGMQPKSGEHKMPDGMPMKNKAMPMPPMMPMPPAKYKATKKK